MYNKLDIKIAFFDIDGTLTDSNKKISTNTIIALKKAVENNIDIVLCSGRSNSYMLNCIKRLDNINYVISSNGARIYDINYDKDIYSNLLNKKDIINIYNYSLENKISFTITSHDIAYVNEYTDLDTYDYKFIKTEIIKNINDIPLDTIYQIILKSSNYEKMHLTENYLNNFNDIYIVNYSIDYITKNTDTFYFFDILNNEVNKGNAVKQLLKYKNIDKKHAICFGDSVNDKDMFDACGISVAMGNALDEIKEKADYITDTNDNDGISKFFDKYIL